MAIFNPLVSSTFTGVDENPLSEGGVWTTATANSALQRVSNAVTPSGVGSDCAAFYSGATFSGNQYSRANLTVVGTAGGGAGIGLFLRQASAANTHYRFVIDHAASNNAELSRHVAGTFLSLLSWTQAFTDGDQFTFAVDGTTLYVYDKNLLLVQSFKDGGGGPIGGSPGLAYSSAETSASIDNWEGGFFAFAALGSSRGNSAHPGRSPGYAPASFRFWQPPSSVSSVTVASPDVTVALTGVSEAGAVGTLGVQHTNAIAGVSTTTATGSVKAALMKALAGVSTITSVGTLGTARARALAGISTATAAGTMLSSRTVPVTGAQAAASVGTVTATTGVVVALTGVSASLSVGTMLAIAQSVIAVPTFSGGYGYARLYRQKLEEELRTEREQWGILPKAAQIVAAVAIRQADALDLDAEQRLGELERELELAGVHYKARYFELLNLQRQRLIDAEIKGYFEAQEALGEENKRRLMLLLAFLS